MLTIVILWIQSKKDLRDGMIFFVYSVSYLIGALCDRSVDGRKQNESSPFFYEK